MPDAKLSALTPATLPLNPTDLLYVAQAGLSRSVQASDVSAPKALSNLDFYVAATGSDSNPGTIGSPFATGQRAVNVGVSYDYQSTYSLAIHIGAGTFAPATQINLPELVNYPANLFATVTGAGPASTTIQPSNGIGFLANGSTATWQIDQVAIDASLYGIFAAQGAFSLIPNGGSIAFKDSTGGGNNRCFNVADGALIQSIGSVDLSALSKMFAYAANGGSSFAIFEQNLGTVTFPVSTSGGGWLLSNFNFACLMNWAPSSVVNATSWNTNGGAINVGPGTILATLDGTISTIPGNHAFDVFDSTCILNNLTTLSADLLIDAVSNTPAGLASGTTNNYTVIEPHRLQRIAANAANSTLTGLKWNVGQQGRLQSQGAKHILLNIGTGTLTLNHQDAGSTKTNRFNNSTGAAIVLSTGQSANLYYDALSANGTDNTGAWLVSKNN